MNFKEIKDIKDKVMTGGCITREEALALTKASNISNLYYSANQLRAKFCGYRARIFTSFTIMDSQCKEDCKFCPRSAKSKVEYSDSNKKDAQSIASEIAQFQKSGISYVKINYIGEKIQDRKLDELMESLRVIKSQCNVDLLPSLGPLSKSQLEKLREKTGIDRYHCNIATSEKFYSKVCSTNEIEAKYQTLTYAKELGYKLSTGIIIGMGETMEDRIDLALKMRDLGIETVFINILYAFEGTELEKQPKIGNQEILTTFAIFRFIMPRATLVLSRGRSLIKIIEVDALHAGINAAIIGELLSETKESDIEYNKQMFDREGFTV